MLASSLVKGNTVDQAPDRDLTGYPHKPLTELQEHLAEWLMDKCDYDPTRDARTKREAFLRGVQLAAVLRMVHQRSPENQERLVPHRRTPKAARKAKKATAKKAAKRKVQRTERRHLRPVEDFPEVVKAIRPTYPAMPRPSTPPAKGRKPEFSDDEDF